MAKRRRSLAGLWAILLVVAVAVPAAIWGPELYRKYSYQLSPERCTATFGNQVDFKTAEQANNAAIIAAVGMSYGFDVQGVTVAIATAIQESSLRNLDWGDRDSLGLFQQRPSQGWGTEEQIMDEHYSASKFYQALAAVDGWQDMELTVAAQRVQRSGFPDAYADHEQEALAWAAAFTGGDSIIDCNVSERPTTAQTFTERVHWDFGAGRYSVSVVGGNTKRVELALEPLPGDDATSESVLAAQRAIQAWAIATASTTGIVEVTLGEEAWVNGQGRFSRAADGDDATRVIVTLATP